MRLEPELWDALNEMCKRERIPLGEMVRRIESAKRGGGRTSAVRVAIVNYFRAAVTEEGHRQAGHGSLPAR
jgi:predicted DNA-binding ribbon-helix-helix protein